MLGRIVENIGAEVIAAAERYENLDLELGAWNGVRDLLRGEQIETAMKHLPAVAGREDVGRELSQLAERLQLPFDRVANQVCVGDALVSLHAEVGGEGTERVA